MSFDYKARDPRGWCGDPRRGAAMGRTNMHVPDREEPRKFHLRKVRMASGGYDCLGTYWGYGETLWVAQDVAFEVEFFTRAATREAARRKVKEEYPEARFFR